VARVPAIKKSVTLRSRRGDVKETFFFFGLLSSLTTLHASSPMGDPSQVFGTLSEGPPSKTGVEGVKRKKSP